MSSSIDIHTHVPLDGTTESLLELLDVDGIDRAVLLGMVDEDAPRLYCPAERTLALCRSDRLIPFVSLDPRRVEADALPAMFADWKEAGVKGLGEYTPNIYLDDIRNIPVFAAAEAIGWPLILHMSNAFGKGYGLVDDPRLERLDTILGMFPDLVVLGHSPAFWRRLENDEGGDGPVIDLMRRHPNLYGDLSAGSGFRAVTRNKERGIAFLKEFSNRLCYGSDITGPESKRPLLAYLHTLQEDKQLDLKDYNLILGGNAERILD